MNRKTDEERAEYWRGEIAEAVRKAAKHGAPEHIDNVVYTIQREQHEASIKCLKEKALHSKLGIYWPVQDFFEDTL